MMQQKSYFDDMVRTLNDNDLEDRNTVQHYKNLIVTQHKRNQLNDEEYDLLLGIINIFV